MSLPRALCVVVQAIAYQIASTPPNPTPTKGRYHTDALYILQIAPLIFRIQQILVWFAAVFEVLYYVHVAVPLPWASAAAPLVCPLMPPSGPSPAIRFTSLFLIGVLAVVLGAYIRVDCFRTLGKLFTFDLTVHPEHKLVTSRFYSYVRHPAYTGSILLIAGLAFSHLSPGSWLTNCGPLRFPGAAAFVWVAWWVWTLSVGVSRAEAEDRQMHRLFKAEWEHYAAQVPWWFFPGII